MSRKRKSEAKHFTEEQIRKFQNDPNIRYVDDHTLRFKYEFRIRLYEAWEIEKRQGIKRVLTENGYDLKELGDSFIQHLYINFKRNGRPQNTKTNQPVGSVQLFRTNPEDNEYFLSTGRFVKSRNGIRFSDDFANELFHKYPEQSIEEGLKAAGIDPAKVGYKRIYTLQRSFENQRPAEKERISYSSELIEKYKDHPYVKKITAKQFVLKDAFYDDACCLRRMRIDDILDLFEFDHKELPVSFKTRIRFRLNHHERSDVGLCMESEQALRINRNIMSALEKEAEKSLKEIHDIVPQLKPLQRKKLCQMIDAMVPDPGKKFTKKYILKTIGISRSSFYSCLKNAEYGLYWEKKESEDEKDVQVIREVLEHDEYPKGTRMIYMSMKKITGRQFGINKIRRLKRKYGITCPVRQANHNRRAARELLERNVCPNHLRRQFRMHRPLEIFLSDVTYLPYGDDKLAYGSACIDAVTGRVMALVISDSNDLSLADKTVETLISWEHSDHSVFHTDQGSLYLSDHFQKLLKDHNFRQSMSKRGNCWDNAPQESFFGHFKDEVNYKNCTHLYELIDLADRYMSYYNTERGQWTRNRMTPVRYQVYLQSMSDEEFSVYLEKETAKYEKMREKAAAKAIERAKTLGV